MIRRRDSARGLLRVQIALTLAAHAPTRPHLALHRPHRRRRRQRGHQLVLTFGGGKRSLTAQPARRSTSHPMEVLVAMATDYPPLPGTWTVRARTPSTHFHSCGGLTKLFSTSAPRDSSLRQSLALRSPAAPEIAGQSGRPVHSCSTGSAQLSPRKLSPGPPRSPRPWIRQPSRCSSKPPLTTRSPTDLFDWRTAQPPRRPPGGMQDGAGAAPSPEPLVVDQPPRSDEPPPGARGRLLARPVDDAHRRRGQGVAPPQSVTT